MKRTKFLALTLVAAVMMMGAGYAYWQEDLAITNTVKTGKLDFTFQAASVVKVDDYMDYGDAESTCVVNDNDNQVDIVLESMYPGAEATVAFELLNSGTMQAKVKNFVVSEFAQDDYFNVTSLMVAGSEKLSSSINILDLDTTLESLGITIEPGDAVSFQLTLEVDSDADEDQVEENLGANDDAIEFSLTADGLQYNDDVN